MTDCTCGHGAITVHHHHHGLADDRLERFLSRLERIMVDFATAADNAIAEFDTLLGELKTAIGLAGVVNPAIQAAADKLQAAVDAAKATDSAEEPAPVAPTDPPVDTPPVDVPPVTEPVDVPVTTEPDVAPPAA